MPEARGLGYCYILPGDSVDLEHLVISGFSSIAANIQVHCSARSSRRNKEVWLPAEIPRH